MKTRIIYEDKDILVCYKPAGLAVQTGQIGRMDMVSELKNYLKSPYLGLVHRLDQPVEGILVFGKNQKTTAALTAQLSKGTLNKEYYAYVCGKPSEKKGELVDYLLKTVDNKAQIVTEREGKKAVLRYEVLGYKVLQQGMLQYEGEQECITTLLKVHIETGRFHQIRAQLSHAGWPILGDQKYGDDQSARVSKALKIRNVALYASQIAFVHPATGKLMCFEEKPLNLNDME